MEEHKGSSFLVACAIMLLCIVLMIGGGYALWSDSASVENHLTAGTLKVKLERISLTKTCLDDTTGYLAVSEDTTTVDLTSSTTQTVNVFGIGENEKIVPCASYDAKLRLTNNGDVAFSYEVIIKLTSVSNELAGQLKVYVNGVDKGYLSAYADAGQAIVATSTMAKNDTAKEFSVKIVFADLDENNAAQNQQAMFDLLVNAVQLTEES